MNPDESLQNNVYAAPIGASGPATHQPQVTPRTYENVPSQAPQAMIDALAGTRPWVKFLAVLTILGAATMGLGGLLMLVGMALVPSSSRVPTPIPTELTAILYVVLAVVYALVGSKMYDFEKSIRRALEHQDLESVTEALCRQRAVWTMWGAISIAMMILVFVTFIAMIAIGMSKGMPT